MAVATRLPDRSSLELSPGARRDLRFPARSRLDVARDVAIIGVCAAIVLGFLAQVWRAPPTPAFRAASVTAVAARA